MKTWREMFLRLPVDARKRYAEMYGKSSMTLDDCHVLTQWSIPRHTRKEMMDFAVENNAYNVERYNAAYAKHKSEKPPMIQQVRFMYGDLKVFFDEVKRHAGIMMLGNCVGDEEFVETCSKLKFNSKAEYERIRRKKSWNWLPSPYVIGQRFGSWELFRLLVQSINIDFIMAEYHKLCHRRGRHVSVSECESHGIGISHAKEVLGEDLFYRLLMKKEEVLSRKKKYGYMATDATVPLELKSMLSDKELARVKRKQKRRSKGEKEEGDSV